jgi:hypothetical protein
LTRSQLISLYGTPYITIAINNSFAGYCNIRCIRCRNLEIDYAFAEALPNLLLSTDTAFISSE